jgi:NADH dehydrogenase
MILLTGATGTVGSALLRRLTADGRPVRALVRDQRRLGEQRVRVQIALGNLADPPSFRNALRGVHTVVHLAASIRDQPGASIEELNAVATMRLLRAAERAGVERFVFFSAMNASHHSRTRFFRAKAIAEEAVHESSLETTVFRPSIVYAPGDPWLTLLDRLSRLPVVPVSGSGDALFQPVWAEDVAAAVMNSLSATHSTYELAGPEVLSYDDIVRVSLRAAGRRRRLLHVPLPLVRASLKVLRFATWEEAELMEEPMVSERGTADIEQLGVNPLPMPAVLGS